MSESVCNAPIFGSIDETVLIVDKVPQSPMIKKLSSEYVGLVVGSDVGEAVGSDDGEDVGVEGATEGLPEGDDGEELGVGLSDGSLLGSRVNP